MTIDVRYTRAEKLTPEERTELNLSDVKEGLIAIETTKPNLKRTGIVIPNDDYVSFLASLGPQPSH